MAVNGKGEAAARHRAGLGRQRWRAWFTPARRQMGMKLHPSSDPTCKDVRHHPPRRLVQYARDSITMPRYYRNDTV